MAQSQRVTKIAQAVATGQSSGETEPSAGTTMPGQNVAALPGAANLGGMAFESEAGPVDLATELTSLIMAQRAYEANAKVLTTADEMMSTLTKMK